MENTTDGAFTCQSAKQKGRAPLREHVLLSLQYQAEISLQLGAGRDQSLAMLVALVLLEVLDEAACQILGLLFPLGSVSIGVARIQNAGVHAVQHGGNLEVEVGDLLGGHIVDVAVQDGVCLLYTSDAADE